MAGLRLNNLIKRFNNGFEAVRGINLDIADGEFVVVIGPSGSGKSTILRMLAGLESVTSGTIYLGDKRIDKLEPSQRDLAMVFQDYALYPQMTVRQNLSFGLRMRKTPKTEIDQRISKAASALSITELLDLRPDQISGGQSQRVAVGRAIVRQPTAFLFDEPLSQLDANLRVQMRAELAGLHQRLGITTVYVTHDQIEAMTLGDRIVVMNQGKIVQIDTPQMIYQKPVNRFVAGFIGSPSMNFIEGTVQNSQFCFQDGISYPLNDGSGKPMFQSSNHQPCTLGARPEDLTTESSHPKLADAVVERVEFLGHGTLIHATAGHARFTVRGDQRSAQERGEKISLHLPIGRWHLFSANSSADDQQQRLVNS